MIYVVRRRGKTSKVQNLLKCLAEVEHYGPPLIRNFVRILTLSSSTLWKKTLESTNDIANDETCVDGTDFSRKLTSQYCTDATDKKGNPQAKQAKHLIVDYRDIVVLAYPEVMFKGSRVIETTRNTSNFESNTSKSNKQNKCRFGTVVLRNRRFTYIRWDDSRTEIREVDHRAQLADIRHSFLEFYTPPKSASWPFDLYGKPKDFLQTMQKDNCVIDRMRSPQSVYWRIADVDPYSGEIILQETIPNGEIKVKGRNHHQQKSLISLSVGLNPKNIYLDAKKQRKIESQSCMINAPEFLMKSLQIQFEKCEIKAYTEWLAPTWVESTMAQRLVVEKLMKWNYERSNEELMECIQSAWEAILLEKLKRELVIMKRKAFFAMKRVRIDTLQAEWNELVRRVPSSQLRIQHAFSLAVHAENTLKPFLDVDYFYMLRIPAHNNTVGVDSPVKLGEIKNKKRMSCHLKFQMQLFEAALKYRKLQCQKYINVILESSKRIQDVVDKLSNVAIEQVKQFVEETFALKRNLQVAFDIAQENAGTALTKVPSTESDDSRTKYQSNLAKILPSTSEDHLSKANVNELSIALLSLVRQVERLQNVFLACTPPPNLSLRMGFSTFDIELRKMHKFAQK